jgi:L-ascorbate metabolism protein UlaG (beta-lactamase superfamily)
MNSSSLRLTYIGGPTALLEIGGLRLLTDPTFDPAGGEYPSGPATLRKLADPAVSAQSVAPIDVVLLSHDHHFDNLDHAGRKLLGNAGKVLTTTGGASRLQGNAVGLDPWQSVDIPMPRGGILRVSGTPARHGPAGMDRGPVTGFVLQSLNDPGDAIYISGDTVWYEGVAEVAQRFSIRTAILFMGAARVPEVGPWHLTMTAEDAIHAARAFADASIVPLHFAGWAHFSESKDEIARAFRAAGLESRLRWLPAGQPTELAQAAADAA